MNSYYRSQIKLIARRLEGSLKPLEIANENPNVSAHLAICDIVDIVNNLDRLVRESNAEAEERLAAFPDLVPDDKEDKDAN